MTFLHLPPVRLARRGWRLIGLVMLAGGLSCGIQAAESVPPPDLPAPFSASLPPSIDQDAVWAQTLAERALEAGMYHLAEGLFGQVLARTDVPPERRRSLELDLISTLLAQGRGDEALAALEAMAEPRDGPWKLRRAIVEYLARDGAALAKRVDDLEVRRLPSEEQAWGFFLRGAVAYAAGDRAKADVAFEDAVTASPSAAATAWVKLAQFQVRLNADEATEALLAAINKNREDNEGRDVGFEATLQYAATLERLGRKDEAVQALIRQRRQLPAGETELRDKTLLLLGLISGVEATEGYTALHDLLEQGRNPDWQRIALQRLVAAADGAAGRARTELPRLLNTLLARPAQHALTEDLLYYRAALALRELRFEDAEADANALLTRFPGSALRPGALALLASSSWQRTRYRSAADFVSRLRVDLPPGADRARLAVLVGECYFRAGKDAGTAEDFRNAAEAYGRAYDEIVQLAADVGNIEAERLTGASLGTLFFQRIIAYISGGNLEGAATLLSGPMAEAVDPESRWQAAWNYVRHLQINRRFEDAFRGLETWGAAENAPPDLRLRFLWLLAQLSLETERPTAETLARVAAVRAFLAGSAGAGVPESQRAQVDSNAALLAAQAQLEGGDTAAGIRAMDQVRRDFPQSNAAIFSYIIQARHLSAAGQLVEAQRLLINLVEQHPDSEYAPRALYEAAEQATKRGADPNLNEAKDLLERLATRFPEDRYEFFARLQQGDILRKLNQFAAAEQVYLLLENRYPNHPDRDIAQLSLAVTLLAQVDNDPAKFDAAVSRLERLTDTAAETDLRVEAGFRLAYGYQNQDDLDRAVRFYWDVYQRFLGEPRPGQAPFTLGPRGRYWLARTLLELGELELKAGRRDNARRSFQAVIEHGLPGQDSAQGRLAHLQAGG